MTTYTIVGFSASLVEGTNFADMLFGGTTLVVVAPENAGGMEYDSFFSQPGQLDEISVSFVGYTARINGVAPEDYNSGFGSESAFGRILWDDGGATRTTYLLTLSNDDTGLTDFFVVGGTPFPEFTSADDYNDFLSFSLLSIGSAPAGSGFGPGDLIDGASVPGVVITQDDVIVGNELHNIFDGGSGNDFIDGSGGSDVLAGGAGIDTLVGGDGVDVLDGGSVPDPSSQGNVLLGGDGNDIYIVRNPLDLVDEGFIPEFRVFGFGGEDSIVSHVNFFWDVYGVGETLTIAEDADDPSGAGTTAIGGFNDNTIIGTTKTNVLFGRGGSDTFFAGDGVDFISLSLLGLDANIYEGVNTIVAQPRVTGDFSYDVVFEFESGTDKLDVTRYGFATQADVFARGVDAGDNSYFALGDGFDYLYMVGLNVSDLSAGDFIV